MCTSSLHGPHCDVECSSEGTCSSLGRCDGSGGCECWPGQVGPACDSCAGGAYGAECGQQCDGATTCSGHGRCEGSGGCVCHDGYVGGACDQCPDGTYGATCATACIQEETCGANGRCSGGGECECHAGSAGVACQECSAGAYGPGNCSGTPVCTSEGTCRGAGRCVADGGCECFPTFRCAAVVHALISPRNRASGNLSGEVLLTREALAAGNNNSTGGKTPNATTGDASSLCNATLPCGAAASTSSLVDPVERHCSASGGAVVNACLAGCDGDAVDTCQAAFVRCAVEERRAPCNCIGRLRACSSAAGCVEINNAALASLCGAFGCTEAQCQFDYPAPTGCDWDAHDLCEGGLASCLSRPEATLRINESYEATQGKYAARCACHRRNNETFSAPAVYECGNKTVRYLRGNGQWVSAVANDWRRSYEASACRSMCMNASEVQARTTDVAYDCAECGDGVRTQGREECDDANRASGDGCSYQCTIEVPSRVNVSSWQSGRGRVSTR